MIRRILVPLDGSALAESVLPCVEHLARCVDAGVRLLRVVEPVLDIVDETEAEQAFRRIERVVLDRQHAAVSEARSYLDGVESRLARAGLVVQTDVIVGQAAEAIVAAAQELDLIAMATHGRSGIGRWVYGSVADKVLHSASVPVLMVRADTNGGAVCQARRILVPLDGSALAEQALPLVTMLAKAANAEVIAVQGAYWMTMMYADPYAYGGAVTALDESEEAGRSYLAGIVRRLVDQGLTAHSEVLHGPTADAILDCASEQAADLIVMSTHGRSGLGRWVLGSVADRVLRGAHAPVVLVRAGVPVERIVDPLPVATAR